MPLFRLQNHRGLDCPCSDCKRRRLTDSLAKQDYFRGNSRNFGGRKKLGTTKLQVKSILRNATTTAWAALQRVVPVAVLATASERVG